MLEQPLVAGSFWRARVLGGMERPFFDILSPGLTRAPAVMHQESSGREGINMREVR